MEGVDASVMELTAIFHLRELPPPGNNAYKDACLQKDSWRIILWRVGG